MFGTLTLIFSLTGKKNKMKLIIPEKFEMQEIINADPRQEVFALDRYYSLLKFVYLKRFKIILKLLGQKSYDNLLDIGFGSGLFFPALKTKCQKLYGLDSHPYLTQVEKMLKKKNISAQLKQGSITQIPFDDNQFDAITCLSVLEFINDTDKALAEITRVASPGAKIIIGAPVNNKITDLCYALIGKKTQNQEHSANQKQIIESIKKHLIIEKIKTIPCLMPVNFSLFFIIQAKKK